MVGGYTHYWWLRHHCFTQNLAPVTPVSVVAPHYTCPFLTIIHQINSDWSARVESTNDDSDWFSINYTKLKREISILPNRVHQKNSNGTSIRMSYMLRSDQSLPVSLTAPWMAWFTTQIICQINSDWSARVESTSDDCNWFFLNYMF